MDPVALYAAIVATLALCWQVYTWRQARLERRGGLDVACEAWWTSTAEAVEATITNPSDYDVRVVGFRLGVYWDRNKFSYSYEMSPGLEGVPEVIPAHDSVEWRVDREALARLDCPLAPGRRVQLSVRTRLRRVLYGHAKVTDLDRWNRKYGLTGAAPEVDQHHD